MADCKNTVCHSILLLWATMITLFVACDSSIEENSPPRFRLLLSDSTGLSFQNNLTPTTDLNVFNFMYFYNGGGIAAADYNNDDLIDLYFTANTSSNKLFLNQGDLKFDDVSAEAGVAGLPEGWTTGASAVDINNDGLMDIYVGQVGEYRKITGANQLFICTGIDAQGIPHYEDRAAEYGLDLKGFATQAAFFDYDRDGDLDMFQMNFSLHQNGTFGQRFTFDGTLHSAAGDKLLRNDDGHFIDVTSSSGIHSSVIGYGLGVVVSDIDNDGWPDLYIGNDFHENDYLYINQQDGTFKEVLTEQLRHTSRFSMGVDVADINNDGYKEIFSADMHPYDPFILKSSLGEDGFSVFEFKLGYGYNHQYARNNLQLNNQNATFSDIGIYAGVHATDWSWAPIFCDLNNDGYRDLFVSNGIPKRMNDIDYVNFAATDEIQARIQFDEIREIDLELIDKLPEIKLENKFFLNNQNLTFKDIASDIAGDLPSFSNGAITADLDNDGDLEVVTNNIYDHPFIYQNLTSERDTAHYLKFTFTGSPKNRHAIGATIIVTSQNQIKTFENYPVRGYQSSQPPGIHIGLGQTVPESITLVWPDGSYMPIPTTYQDTTLHVLWKKDLMSFDWHSFLADTSTKAVRNITQRTGLDFQHDENPFVEFNREQLVPHMTSSEGPALAIADINGDGQDDVYFGGAKHQKSAIYVQRNGVFTPTTQLAISADSLFEDVDAIFADVDNDSDADLIVASGGNEYRGQAEPLKPRVYLNNGDGQFTRKPDAFDSIYVTASCVLAEDFTGDGHIDLFIGGRAQPWRYGERPRSFLLANDGSGTFADVTSKYSSDLSRIGMVKDGVWADIDSDGDNDLILALEWGPVTILYRNGERYVKAELKGTNGWWNFILPADYDQDGDIDFIAGNTGKNSKLKPSADRPVKMFVNDFDDNGQPEQIITYFLNDQNILLPTFAEVTKQMPALKKNFLFAKDFASASIEDLFGADKVAQAEVYVAFEFANSYFENSGSGKFTRHDLPDRLQFSPLKAGLNYDANLDGLIDVMLWGNYSENNIELGRYDADYGSILYNDGTHFSNSQIELMNITGQVRNARMARAQNQTIIILGRNDEACVVLTVGDKHEDENF